MGRILLYCCIHWGSIPTPVARIGRISSRLYPFFGSSFFFDIGSHHFIMVAASPGQAMLRADGPVPIENIRP